MSVCRAIFPFSLPRATLIGRPEVCSFGVLCCLFVRVSCRSPNSTSPTRTTCCGHHREDPRIILIRHVRHARFPRDMSATSLRGRGCHEDATRKLLPWNLSYIQHVHIEHSLVPNLLINYWCLSRSDKLTRMNLSYVPVFSTSYLVYAARRSSVCSSVRTVGGSWSHSVTKVEIGT